MLYSFSGPLLFCVFDIANFTLYLNCIYRASLKLFDAFLKVKFTPTEICIKLYGIDKNKTKKSFTIGSMYPYVQFLNDHSEIC